MSKELRNVSTVGVSGICYNPFTRRTPRQNLLAAVSWDKKIRIYDTDANSLQLIEDYPGPVLSSTFMEDRSTGGSLKLAAVGMGKVVTLYNIDNGKSTNIGSHSEPIRNVSFHASTGLLYTSGWDNTVKCWDTRTSNKECVAETKLGGKAFAMDLTDQKLIVIDSYKQGYIYNIAQPGFSNMDPLRPQLMKYQMRCVKCFPDGTGFAVGSTEGRVAWEYFDLSPEVQAKKYAFKCHRTKESTSELVYPVHALAFHPQTGTFSTGGGDGSVSVWDGFNKKRLWRLPPFKTSISALAFNPTGTQLAISVSYTFDEGPKDPFPPTQIMIREVSDDDVKPKSS